MNAMPAKVAGVERIVMVVPAPDGVINPLVLVAADLAGVDEIYRVGGAQAVAALAYGTETIRAGRQDRRPRQRLCRRRQAPGLRHGRHRHDRRPVRGAGDRRRATTIPTGSPPTSWPRPSTTPPRSRSSSPTTPAFADAVEAAVERQLQTLPRARDRRRELARFRRGHPRRRPRRRRAARRPHRRRASRARHRRPRGACSRSIRNAGAVFLGRHTPEVIGDYVGGSNHVLPTARSARFSSGLSVLDFVKRTSILKLGPEQLRALGAGGDRAGRGRGARRAWPLRRHPAEPVEP